MRLMRLVVESGLRRRRLIADAGGGDAAAAMPENGAWERELVLYASLNPSLELRRMPVQMP